MQQIFIFLSSFSVTLNKLDDNKRNKSNEWTKLLVGSSS